MIGKRVLRKREVLERLGIRKTTLYENFIKTGRLRFVKIGARAVGVIEDELDALIEELRRERDRKPRAVCERPDVNALTAEDAAASTTEPIPVGQSRMRGDDAPFVKLGRSVRYTERALSKWTRTHTRNSTSQR